MQALEIVHGLIFGGDLLDVVEIVRERFFAEKFVKVGDDFRGFGRELLEGDEVHAIAEAAGKRVADAVVGDADDLVFPHQDIAAAFDGLELAKTAAVGWSGGSGWLCEIFLKLERESRGILCMKTSTFTFCWSMFGQFEVGEPNVVLLI